MSLLSLSPLSASLSLHTRLIDVTRQIYILILTWEVTTLNTPVSESGSDSSHTHAHNPTKSQTYQWLKLLPSDTKLTTTVTSMLIYHGFEENQCMLAISARSHMLVSDQCQMPRRTMLPRLRYKIFW